MTTTAARACPGHGARVGERYDVDDLLVADGRLCVHEGHDSALRRRVVIHLAIGADPTPASSWLPLPDGIRLGRGPGLGEVFDGGREGRTLYLVTQRAEGAPLTEELRARPLSPDEVRDLGLRIAAALAPLHRAGSAHGALGPQAVTRLAGGVLIGGVGAREWIARWAGVEITPPFPAPESRRGVTPGPPADVYALGRLLSAVAGPSTDPELARLVEEMTARDPAARPDVRTVVRRLASSWSGSHDVRRSVRPPMVLVAASVALACAATLAVGGPRLFAEAHRGSGDATVGIGAPATIATLPPLPQAAVTDSDPSGSSVARRVRERAIRVDAVARHRSSSTASPGVTARKPGRTTPSAPESAPPTSRSSEAAVHPRPSRSASTSPSASASTSTSTSAPTSSAPTSSAPGPTRETHARPVDATERTAPSTSSRSDR